MPEKLSWEAFTDHSRIQAIEEVKDVISINGGCIVNFSMFSDLALSLSIEIEENRIFGLYKTLSSILKISGFDIKNINSESAKERLIFLNISFSSGRGELKNEIPDVPG